MKKVKIILSAIVIIVFVFVLSGIFSVKADAKTYSWMSRTKTIVLNKTYKNVAVANTEPSFDSPGYVYNGYYYFYVPKTMKVKLQVALAGTRTGMLAYLYYSNGTQVNNGLFGGPTYTVGGDWVYNRAEKYNKISNTMTLKKGYYYLNLWDYGDVRDNKSFKYSFRLTTYLNTKVTLQSVKKYNTSSVVFNIKRASGVTGYKFYYSTSPNGTYKEFCYKASNKYTSLISAKVKRNKTYYYKVRGYVKINGKYYYTPYSNYKKYRL